MGKGVMPAFNPFHHDQRPLKGLSETFVSFPIVEGRSYERMDFRAVRRAMIECIVERNKNGLTIENATVVGRVLDREAPNLLAMRPHVLQLIADIEEATGVVIGGGFRLYFQECADTRGIDFELQLAEV